MTARIVLVWASLCLVGAAAVQACGGKDDGDGGTVADASTADVSVDGSKSDGAGGEPDPTCDPNADFTTQIPDASIADGASSTGTCVACVNAKCGSAVDACNANCICQGVAGDGLTCFLKNSSNPLACAGDLGPALADTEARTAAYALLGCVNTSCNEECALDAFLPSDGGDDAN